MSKMKPKEGDMIARIEGYASIFNTPDLNGDVVAPGAFTKALREKGAREIRMLYQHAAETPIGRWTKFREDARDLRRMRAYSFVDCRARSLCAPERARDRRAFHRLSDRARGKT